MQLDSVKAIVTGGGSGMGRAFAVHLARSGADVTICDLNEDAMAETQQEAEGAPGTIHSVVANVADENDVVTLVNDAYAKMGGLNALVNNAGIFRDGLLVKKDRETGAVKKMSLKNWQSVIDVDLTGPFLCTREFAAKCIETDTKPGVIVNISSIARHGNPGQTNYSAAKAGLIADTRLWSLELSRYGLRTGAVAPGFVDTPILQGMREDVLEKMLKGVPLRRAASTEEIWLAVKFILECDYFTGRCIDVDGGLSV